MAPTGIKWKKLFWCSAQTGNVLKYIYYQILLRGAEAGAEPGVAVATTDLSLATPLATLLKTAVFVPFFLTRNAFIKTTSTSNGRHQIHIKFSFASAPGTTSAKWASVE